MVQSPWRLLTRLWILPRTLPPRRADKGRMLVAAP